MAYEVTKSIKGRDYRYRVEGYRDTETGQTRTHWQYLGRVTEDGAVTAPVRRSDRTTREKIVQGTMRLLESRDASRITVSVIAHHVGISQATFYRYFSDRKSVFTAALTHLADRTLETLTLDGPLGTAADERRRLSEWLDELHRSLLRQRAFRWSFSAGDRSKAKGHVERSLLKHDAYEMLRAYLRRLRDAGLTSIDEADAFADSIMSINAAFIYYIANDDLGPDRRRLRIADAYLVIERAIFGPA